MSSNNFDVLVIGGGMSGLSAATAAAEAGAKVLLVEKGDRVGGSAQYSAGMFFTARDFNEMINYVPNTTPELVTKLLEDFMPAVEKIKKTGVKVADEFIPTVTMGHAYPTDVKSLFVVEENQIKSSGGEVRKLTAGSSLLTDSQGKVVGATLRHVPTGVLYDVRAKAVILSSGGFQGSTDLRARYIGFGADNLFIRSNENSVGDGLKMATAVGAGLSKGLSTFYGHLLPSPLKREQVNPHKFPWISQYQSTYSLLVNLAGKRFCDERMGDDVNNQEVLRQHDRKAWLLLDSRVHREWCVAPPFPNAGTIDRLAIAKDYGAHFVKASTVEELVEGVSKYGVDKVTLAKTLSDFSKRAKGDTSIVLDAPARDMSSALVEAPFYALEVQPAITFPFGGLKINTSGQALTEDGLPIPGLFVAGVDAGGFSNYKYAGGLSIAYITGQWAGKSAAALAAAPAPRL